MKNSEKTSVGNATSLLSRQQVAARLGTCCRTVARLEQRGLLRAIRISARLIRYRESDVLALLK